MTTPPIPDLPPVIALGGVGMPAFAALPLIEVLEKRAIAPRAVFASGFGCLVAALWGTQRGAGDIERFVRQELAQTPIRKTRPGASLALLGIAFGKTSYPGLWRERRFRALLDRCFGDRRLEALTFPLTLCVTDVETARLERVTSGRLADAVYAGCAHFPLLPPGEIGGRAVCDGSYLQPLPLLAAADEPGPILAVEAYLRNQSGPSRVENLHQQIFGLYHRHVTGLQRDAAQAIHPWPVRSWRVCVEDSGDAWDAATAVHAIAAGRKALGDMTRDLAMLAGRAA
jgi:predicted acylesterase/phospholipase RssA